MFTLNVILKNKLQLKLTFLTASLHNITSSISVEEIARIFQFNPFLNTASSIWMNPKLRIGNSSFIWKEWIAKGILKLGDVYENNVLKSFNQLTQSFGLNKTQFWRFLQLRHLLCGVFGSKATRG